MSNKRLVYELLVFVRPTVKDLKRLNYHSCNEKAANPHILEAGIRECLITETIHLVLIDYPVN